MWLVIAIMILLLYYIILSALEPFMTFSMLYDYVIYNHLLTGNMSLLLFITYVIKNKKENKTQAYFS